MYRIDADVPLPAAQRSSQYPFAALRVGQSFFVPGGTVKRLTSAVGAFRRNRPEWRFSVRLMTEDGADGVRVWRVDDRPQSLGKAA